MNNALIEGFLGSLAVFLLLAVARRGGFLLDFVFFYPLFMAFVWIAGGLHFHLRWERPGSGPDDLPRLPDDPPLVSVIVPCFNEGDNVAEIVAGIAAQSYPNFEIIAVNDGSRDGTGLILERLTETYPRLRVVDHAANQGKAMALRMAARGEFLVGVDGDAVLHRNAHLVAPMLQHPRVGGHRQSARPHPLDAPRADSGRRVLLDHRPHQARPARLWRGLHRLWGAIAAFRRRALHPRRRLEPRHADRGHRRELASPARPLVDPVGAGGCLLDPHAREPPAGCGASGCAGRKAAPRSS